MMRCDVKPKCLHRIETPLKHTTNSKKDYGKKAMQSDVTLQSCRHALLRNMASSVKSCVGHTAHPEEHADKERCERGKGDSQEEWRGQYAACAAKWHTQSLPPSPARQVNGQAGRRAGRWTGSKGRTDGARTESTEDLQALGGISRVEAAVPLFEGGDTFPLWKHIRRCPRQHHSLACCRFGHTHTAVLVPAVIQHLSVRNPPLPCTDGHSCTDAGIS